MAKLTPNYNNFATPAFLALLLVCNAPRHDSADDLPRG